MTNEEKREKEKQIEEMERNSRIWDDFATSFLNFGEYVYNPGHKKDVWKGVFCDLLRAARHICEIKRDVYVKKCKALKTLQTLEE